MPNHVLYDRIWDSEKLAQCSKPAALAYPWIFLVADSYGRFEYSPKRIWARVFGGREDISLSDVASWLDEYERVGLLVRYHINGSLAFWYKFRARRDSYKRKSEYVAPTKELIEMAREDLARVRGESALLPREVRAISALPPREVRENSATGYGEGVGEGEGTNGSSAVPAAASRDKPARRPTWLTPYGVAWTQRWGDDSEPPWGEMGQWLKKPVGKHGTDAVLERWKRFLVAADSSQFARPARFVQGYGEWSEAKRARASPGKSLGDEMAEGTALFLAMEGSGGRSDVRERDEPAALDVAAPRSRAG